MIHVANCRHFPTLDWVKGLGEIFGAALATVATKNGRWLSPKTCQDFGKWSLVYKGEKFG